MDDGCHFSDHLYNPYTFCLGTVNYSILLCVFLLHFIKRSDLRCYFVFFSFLSSHIDVECGCKWLWISQFLCVCLPYERNYNALFFVPERSILMKHVYFFVVYLTSVVSKSLTKTLEFASLSSFEDLPLPFSHFTSIYQIGVMVLLYPSLTTGSLLLMFSYVTQTKNLNNKISFNLEDRFQYWPYQGNTSKIFNPSEPFNNFLKIKKIHNLFGLRYS